MGVFPINFRKSADASASYDWQDFITNVGYVRFNGAGAYTGASSVSYFLTSNKMDSETYIWSTSASSGADIDVDFDITFQSPAIIAVADAIVAYTFYVSKNNDVQGNPVATVYHVTSGGTETSLGTASGPTVSGNAISGPFYHRTVFKIPLTLKAFKIGEKLRLNVQVTNAFPPGSGGTTTLYHDPTTSKTYSDESARTVGSDLTFDCPFKIDI